MPAVLGAAGTMGSEDVFWSRALFLWRGFGAWLSTRCEAGLAPNFVAGATRFGAALGRFILGLQRGTFQLRLAGTWLWRLLAWPYGGLGRTGWLRDGRPLPPSTLDTPSAEALATEAQPSTIFTRWFAGGHSTYFTPEHIETTFEQVYADLTLGPRPTAEPQKKEVAI